MPVTPKKGAKSMKFARQDRFQKYVRLLIYVERSRGKAGDTSFERMAGAT